MNLTGSLPEFGAGTGTLITQLVADGCAGTFTGADLLPRPAGIPRRHRVDSADLNAPLPSADGSFDAIISTEVIGPSKSACHLQGDSRVCCALAGAAADDTESGEHRSLASLIVRGHHVAFLDESCPAHRALVRKDLERLCLEAGFEPPVFSSTDYGALPEVRRR